MRILAHTVVVALALGPGCRPTTRPPTSPPPAPKSTSSGPREAARPLTVVPSYVGGAADGSIVVLHSSSDAPGGRLLHRFHWFDVRAGKEIAHSEFVGSMLGFAWVTGDGEQVVIADLADPEPATARTVFMVADRGSGATRRILELDGWTAASAAFGDPMTVAARVRFKCRETLHVFDLDDTETIAIELDPHKPTESLDDGCDFGTMRGPMGHPGGPWFATLAEGQRLEFRDAHRGSVVRTVDLGRRPGRIEVTPDGRGFFELKSDGMLLLRDATSGETQWSLAAYEYADKPELFAIDGDRVAVLLGRKQLTVFSRAKGRGRSIDVGEDVTVDLLGRALVVYERGQAIRIFDASLEPTVSIELGVDGTLQLGSASAGR